MIIVGIFDNRRKTHVGPCFHSMDWKSRWYKLPKDKARWSWRHYPCTRWWRRQV